MANVIVNLVSEQTTPNFLFIKEMIQNGDELLFISSEKFEKRIDWIVDALHQPCVINKIILPHGVEEKWLQMIDLIKQKLTKDKQYLVNLTCGTKFMISAVPKAFDGYSAEFYYIPFPKNVILKIGDETYNKIHYRMTIKEYFECNNMEFKDSKAFIKTEDYTKCVFEKFIDTESDFYDVIERIRVGYREKRINVKEIETRENTEKKPQISNLSKFIKEISFPQSESGFLTKDETVYLTGGWFEEYIFSLIKKSINPQDIALGVPLPISENRRVNKRDLDVVFTYENKLFVIECKTGINKESILSETVYKAAALKNERLGRLSAHTSIFSLSGENEEFRDIARAMNIFYYDRTFFVNEEKFESILSDINSKAKG